MPYEVKGVVARSKGAPVSVETIVVPDPGPGEAVVDVQACGVCHGPDLKGLGPVPPLAGRSPSYTVRQLFDFQQGNRKGAWSALMKAAVERLAVDDMIAIAAYTASREP